MSVESFGSVVMVTNFLSTYQSLIYPDSTSVITTNALLKALGDDGEEGFETLSDVLIAILQVSARCFHFEAAMALFSPKKKSPTRPV